MGSLIWQQLARCGHLAYPQSYCLSLGHVKGQAKYDRTSESPSLGFLEPKPSPQPLLVFNSVISLGFQGKALHKAVKLLAILCQFDFFLKQAQLYHPLFTSDRRCKKCLQ